MVKNDDVITNKIESIIRCVKRAKEDYAKSASFSLDYTSQDACILNIQRACQQTIALANYIVRVKELGVPKQSRDAFIFLFKDGILEETLAKDLQNMVSFRNLAIHEYDSLDVSIVESIILNKLDNLLDFGEIIKKLDE